MAVNLIDSNDIEVSQTGNNIKLNLTQYAKIPWKVVGDIHGGSAISLPDTWNEVMIVCTYDNNIYRCLTFQMPYGTPAEQYLRLSYYGGGNDWANIGYWYGSNNDIALYWYVVDGTAQDSANVRTQIFYR